MKVRSLKDLAVGEATTIQEIVGEDSLAIRLMEMGLIEGESIRLIAYAPLGDPIEFELRDYRISLRAREAERVLVQSSAP